MKKAEGREETENPRIRAACCRPGESVTGGLRPLRSEDAARSQRIPTSSVADPSDALPRLQSVRRLLPIFSVYARALLVRAMCAD